MQKVITLPVRCSVVRKSTSWLKHIIIAEAVLLYLISLCAMFTVDTLGSYTLDLLVLLVLFVGLIVACVLAIIGWIEGWYVDRWPKFECIKDE